MQEIQVQSLCWVDPLEKEKATHSSSLAWKSHGRRSLASYNPWGHKESDFTFFLFFLSNEVKFWPKSQESTELAIMVDVIKCTKTVSTEILDRSMFALLTEQQGQCGSAKSGTNLEKLKIMAY